MQTILLLLLLLAPSLGLAQAFEAPLSSHPGKDGYAAIEFMSAAPSSTLADIAEEMPASAPRDQRFRLVVYRSEIYQSLAIEKITTGLEGCCTKLAQSRSVDLQAFATHFGFKGELSGFAFGEWTSPNSFGFNFRGKPFAATVLNNGKKIRIESQSGR